MIARASRAAILVAMLAGLDACARERVPESADTRMTPDPAASPPEAAALSDCARKSAAQSAALANDPLVTTATFAAYPATESLRGAPADADPASDPYAREFRTRLGQELAEHEVNFAGAYSIVSVGMTGWGENWYIVDRRNGRVTPFPYFAPWLDFRPDSRLIVMNPRAAIEKAKGETEVDCWFLNQQEFTTLRPFYFVWEDGTLVRLGPADAEPPRNRFWDEYLGSASTHDR